MLIQLKIENIALIEIIEINFEKGLNIITGDSGSGKSLILDSLNVLFGGTNIPLKHLIRPGKDHCMIEAIFSSSPQINNWLISNGFEGSCSELKIKKKSFRKNNKILSKYNVNNLSINKQLLEKLGRFLIDFAGQSDTFIFDTLDKRRTIIDDLASQGLRNTSAKIKNIWEESEVLKLLMNKKIESLNKQEENNFVIKQMLKSLEEANLNSSEEISELELLENKLVNNLEINNSIQSSLENLNNFSHDKPSVASLINQSIKTLNKTADFDSDIQKFREKLLNIQSNVEELIFALNSYLQDIENYESNLPEIQKRLFFLKNLERTFSLDLPKLIEKRDQLKMYFQQNDKDDEISQIKSLLTQKIFSTGLDSISLLVFVPILFFYSPILFTVVLVFSLMGAIASMYYSKKQREAMGGVGKADAQRQEFIRRFYGKSRDLQEKELANILPSEDQDQEKELQ